MNSNPVILLVDDDADLRILIRDAVVTARPDADIHEAASAPEAIAFLEQCDPSGPIARPDVIYLDIEMFGHSGLSVLHKVKTTPKLRDIPVVMFTGVDDIQQKHKAAQLGANSYILKPFDPLVMLATVRKITDYWLNLHQLCRGA